jgi:RNA polymerase sigma-70 factor (ECF subfamily)
MGAHTRDGTFSGASANSQVMSLIATEPVQSSIASSVAQPERFARAFDAHFAAIHRYLARRVGRELADDLASQCFTVAFERRASFDERRGNERAWLLGIATNLLRDHWRAEQRMLHTMARLSLERVGCAPPEDGELAGALAQLEPDQRDVLFLHVWADLSYEEIAGALGVPLGTVRSRLARGRARLRDALGGGKEPR